MEDNSKGKYLDITKKPMHLPDFRIARGQWLYHIGVGISRVAPICQFHHSWKVQTWRQLMVTLEKSFSHLNLI